MFGDQLKMGDAAMVRLQCAHQFTGAEMKCVICGQFYQPDENKMQAGQVVTEDFGYTEHDDDW